MNRQILTLAASAALLVTLSAGAGAESVRERRGPAAERYVQYHSASRNRGPDLYSVPRGAVGPVTATTPNGSGNLGGPGTGGGSGSP